MSLPAQAPKLGCEPGAGGAGEGLALEGQHWQREGSLIWGTLTEALLSARHCREGRHHPRLYRGSRWWPRDMPARRWVTG